MPSSTVNFSAPQGNYGVGAAQIDGVNVGCIVHSVSKYDTLAGVAIKYGVEVADIKKMNGLVTDLQMFALPSLYIPSHGRHPPSLSLPNDSTSLTNLDQIATRRQLKFPDQKLSSSMNNLQKLYGLKPPTTKSSSGGSYVGGYKMRKSYERARSSEIDFWSEKGCLHSGDVLLMELRDEAAEGSVDSYRRRWSKSEFDMGWETPEKVLREEHDISSHSSFSSITGKSLALRPKSGSRGTLASEDSGWLSSSSSSGDSPTADAPGKVRKSYSLSSMTDMGQTRFSSFWANTKWPDLQSLSTSTLTKPLIEGLPIIARKIKAALD